MDERTDVVVVGAGFTGLSAARALRDRGLSVMVVEARARVGGRVEAVTLADGTRWDTGGQFLCEDMPEIMALAEGHGLELVETRWQGTAVAIPEGDDQTVEEELDALFEALDEADPSEPALDGLSVADWLATRTASPEASRRFASFVEGLWCLPHGQIPFWHLAESIQRDRAETSELQFFLKDAMASLAEAMAADLGEALRLGTPVRQILCRENGVAVETDGGSVEARHVVVAVPPAKAGAIGYEPALPEAITAALGAWRSGMVIKVLLLYPQRFWPTSMSSGLMWRDRKGLFVYDGSMDDDHACLIAFIGGQLAQDWHGKGEAFLRDELVERLRAALGPQAGAPLEVIIRDWIDDPWSGGGYSDVIVDFSARDAEDILRAGTPQITFAASELSTRFPTYIEGAVIAGQEAAARVAGLLRARNDGDGPPA